MRLSALWLVLFACLPTSVSGGPAVRGAMAAMVSMGDFLLKQAELSEAEMTIASLTSSLVSKKAQLAAAKLGYDGATQLSNIRAAASAALSKKIKVTKEVLMVVAVVTAATVTYEAYYFTPTDHYKVRRPLPP